MEWRDVVAQRRMVRDFDPAPIDDGALMRMLDRARRVPSAGFSQGTDFVVLRGERTSVLWDCTLPADERASFRWPGLLRAPVIVLPLADADAYVSRYASPDKAATGLGRSADAWPVPYWYVDSGMAVMVLLQAAVDEGFGALFFGIFRNEEMLLERLGVPVGRRAVGAVAIGHPSEEERARRSAQGSPSRRARRSLDEVVHLDRW